MASARSNERGPGYSWGMEIRPYKEGEDGR
jgi:hypothetical protein